MYCPLCTKEFSVEETDVGKSVICPGCQVPILVENKTLLLNCPECGRPLSVELWMIGEEAVCPDCGKEITLHIPKKEEENAPTGQEDAFQAAETLLPGETVGNYQVIRCLGIGGMGEVYLVRHTEMGTVCALKLLKPEIGAKNPVFSERLIREAKIAAKLRHPNLIQVMDAHRDLRNNCSYIVMEYVDGDSVSDLIKRRGPLPEAMVLNIAKSVASVLVTAEMNGIVHRDIKPSNIMLTREGEVKLADMGIAKVSNEDIGNTLTQGNAVLGTPNYASPEQLRNSHKVDTRSDIYSLGVTMFHMLTGQMPFGGETIFSVISSVLEKELPSLLEINPKISQGTALLVERMASKNQEERPSSAGELLRLLEEIDTTKIASEGQIRKLVQKKRKARSSNADEKEKKSRPLWQKILRAAVIVLLLSFICVYGFKAYEVLDNSLYKDLQISDEELEKQLQDPSVRKLRKYVNAASAGAFNEERLILAACRSGNVKFLDFMDQNRCMPHLSKEKYLSTNAMDAAVNAEKADAVQWFLKKNPDNSISIMYRQRTPAGGNLKKLRFFVECGGRIQSIEKAHKYYPLMEAIIDLDSSPEFFDYCLKHGMNPWNDRYDSLLSYVLKKTGSHGAGREKLLKWLADSRMITPDMLNRRLLDLVRNDPLLDRLLRAGFDPLSLTARGEHFLNMAIRENMDRDGVMKMIDACSGFPAETGKDSPLYAAARRGDTAIIRALMKRGLKADEEILLQAPSPAIRNLLDSLAPAVAKNTAAEPEPAAETAVQPVTYQEICTSETIPDLAGWKQPPVSGWNVHLGKALQEARSSGKKVLLFSFRSSQFPDFLEEQEFREFISRHLIPVFFDWDTDGLPAAQAAHQKTVSEALGTTRFWISTVLLKPDGEKIVLIPALSNHRKELYRTLLQKAIDGKPISFDSENNYVPEQVEKKAETPPDANVKTVRRIPSGQPRTLNERLGLAKQRCEYLQNLSAPADHEKQMLKVFKVQVATLEKLIRQKQALPARPPRSHDAEMTRRFQEEIRVYTARKKAWGYNNEDLKFSDRLLRMLGTGRVDPDAPLVDSTYPKYSGNLEALMRSGRIQKEEELLRAWLRLSPRGIPEMRLESRYWRQPGIALLKLDYPMEDPCPGGVQDFVRHRGLMQKLILAGMNLESGDRQKRTPLLHAILQGQFPVVQDLLQGGADPNTADSRGNAALHYAEAYGRSQMIPLLLESGADEKALNRAGKRPEECRVQKRLWDAIRSESREQALQAIRSGAAPDWLLPRTYRYYFPLAIAAEQRDSAIAVLLLSDDVERRGQKGKRSDNFGSMNYYTDALEHLLSGNMISPARWQVADILVSKGANVNTHGCIRSRNGKYQAVMQSDRRGYVQFMMKHRQTLSRYWKIELSYGFEKAGFQREAQTLRQEADFRASPTSRRRR